MIYLILFLSNRKNSIMKKIIFILLFATNLCVGQVAENSEWHFGSNKLVFPNTTANPNSSNSNQNLINSPNNCGLGSVSDSSGNLLFTAQKHIKDVNGNIMPNGNDIHLGNSYKGTQSSVIIKSLEDENQYYVFTNDKDPSFSSSVTSNGLNYSVVDMSLNSGLGDVIPGQKDINLYNGLVPNNMTATISGDGQSYWLIVTPRTENTNDFRVFAYNITCSGISDPVISLHPPVNFPSSFGNGQVKISPNGEKIAFAWESAKIVTFANFDNETGIVSNNYTTIDTSSYIGEWALGIEFSPDSSKLYITTGRTLGQELLSRSSTNEKKFKKKTGSSLIQVPIFKSLNGTPLVIYSTTTGVIVRLQLAVNNKIYATRGSNFNPKLGAINSPNSLGTAANFELNAITLSAHNGNFLPQLVPIVQEPILDCCVDDWPKIYGTGAGGGADDFIFGMNVDSQDNVIVSGVNNSSDYVNGGTTQVGTFIVKYDECGEIIWLKQDPLNAQRRRKDIVFDNLDDIYFTYSNYNTTSIKKINKDTGNSIWTTELNNFNNIKLSINTSTNEIIFATPFNNSVNLSQNGVIVGTATTSYNSALAVGRINATTGIPSQIEVIGSNANHIETTDLKVDDSGLSIYISGFASNQSNQIDGNSYNINISSTGGNYQRSGFVTKLNLSLQENVMLNLPNVGFVRPSFLTSDFFVAYRSGTSNILERYTTTGGLTNTEININQIHKINDLRISGNDDIFISYQGGNVYSPYPSSKAIFLEKYSPNFNLIWRLESLNIINNFSLINNIIGVNSTGEIFIAGGYSWGPIELNSEITLPTPTNFDDVYAIYVLRVLDENTNAVFGREANETSLITNVIDFNIVPNPSNGVAKIFFPTTDQNYTIDIVDFTGNKISSSKNNPNIDLTSFPKGIYFVKVTDEKGNSKTKKIIKE